MSNLLNNQFHNLRLEIDESEYWDFFINKDSNVRDYDLSLFGKGVIDECLISYIDTRDSECITENGICSKGNYIWDNATTNPYTLYNIGYVGMDNGFIPFKRDEVSNKEFYELFTKSKFTIGEDARLRLYKIDGNTKKTEYSTEITNNGIKLNGGFYQGAFMTECGKYQVLPNKLDDGDVWQLEFVLKKEDFEKQPSKTLNSKYPNNKGIFFYIGTRAENKWIYLYNKTEEEKDLLLSYFSDYADEDGTENPNFQGEMIYMEKNDEDMFLDDYMSSKYYDNILYNKESIGLNDYFYGSVKPKLIDESQASEDVVFCCYAFNGDKFDLLADFDEIEHDEDYIEEELDIDDFQYDTEEGFDLSVSHQWFLETDNKFLMFDRTCQGLTTPHYKEGDKARYVGVRNNFNENLFLLMDRTCNGLTTRDIDRLREESTIEYDVYKDLYNNAFALRITDDGRVGYRYIVRDCESEDGYKIIEGYSSEGIVKNKELVVISVRIKGFTNTMSLDFYVNGKLKFLTSELPKFNFRKLDDLYEKQEMVPFNISLGGGSQGLMETVLPNYNETSTKVYPIEENFGGTFVGYLYSFRFYLCNLNFFEINNNYQYEKVK